MQIRIDLIAPSPHPVRSSWDEDKMAELAQSVKEQGIIVPIKVRPAEGDMCEIVYGHRRVEAARRAGLTDVPAFIEGLEEEEAHTQGGIENLVREDMTPMDVANWCQDEKDSGIPVTAIASRVGKTRQWVYDHLSLLGEPEAVKELVQRGDVTYAHVLRVRPEHLDDKAKVAVLEKAAKEGLSEPRTKEVAQAVAAAEDDAEREAIIDTEYHDPAFQRLVRVKSEVKRETMRRERKDRQENPREVAEYIKALQAFTGQVTVAVKVAEYGKFSPEATQFVIGWHDSLRRRLTELEQAMEDYNA